MGDNPQKINNWRIVYLEKIIFIVFIDSCSFVCGHFPCCLHAISMGWHDERKSNNGAYGCAQYAHHNRLHSGTVPQDQKVNQRAGDLSCPFNKYKRIQNNGKDKDTHSNLRQVSFVFRYIIYYFVALSITARVPSARRQCSPAALQRQR